MSTSRCTPSCSGAIFPGFWRPVCRFFHAGGIRVWLRPFLWLWRRSAPKRQGQRRGQKSSPSFRAVMGFRPVRREVGQPPPALLDGHTLPQQQRGKLVKAGGGGKGFPYGLPQLLLVRFKLGLPGRDTACNHGGVLLVQRGLSLFLRPILPVCDAVLAAVQEVDLVKPLPVAHLHDFGLEVAQGSVGTAVLATGFRVGWPVHVGQERHFLNPQAVNDDMHMECCRCGYARPGGCIQGLGGRGNALCRIALPNACARSTVRPLSGPSRGSKLMI